MTIGMEKSGKILENCAANLENADVGLRGHCMRYFSCISWVSASEVQIVTCHLIRYRIFIISKQIFNVFVDVKLKKYLEKIWNKK